MIKCFFNRLEQMRLTPSYSWAHFNNQSMKSYFSSAPANITRRSSASLNRSSIHSDKNSIITIISNSCTSSSTRSWHHGRLISLERRLLSSQSFLKPYNLDNNDNHDDLATNSEDDDDTFESRNILQDRWNDMLQQLIEYRETYGDTLVPMQFEPNPKLGTWVDNQRHQYRCYKAGKQAFINKERIQILEKEGFVWDVYTQVWEQNLNDLIAYKEKFGNCNIPKNTEGYESLWLWSSTQRRNYQLRKGGQHSPMTDERIEALEKIGFIWSIQEDVWNQFYDELKDYKANHGDCMVPKVFESNSQLAKWVDTQRTQYRNWKNGEPTSMTEDRIARLECIDFVWNVYDFRWNARFEELEQFALINGHFKVPNKSPLYRWSRRQQLEYVKYLEGGKSNLTDSRREKLIEIGFLLK